MINLLLGGPGGGKSYEAVAYHILPAVKRGRKVITNLPLNLDAFEAVEPGCTDLIEIRTKTLAVAPDAESADDGFMGLINRARASRFLDRPFAHVEDYSDTWRSADGMGPLYVVDECHFVLPKNGTAKAVEEWFSMHRHFNVDVLLITQSSGKISEAIRDLVQVVYKVRKAIGLGRPNGYIRKVLDGVNGGEVSVSERKYRPEMFKLYRSHTQGVALEEQHADDVAPLMVRFNRFKWAFYAVTAVAVVYAVSKGSPFSTKPVLAKSSPAVVAAAPARVASAPGVAASAPGSPASAPVDDSEPFKGRGLHISGWLGTDANRVYTFVVSSNQFRLFDTTDAELKKAGYSFEPLGYCMGALRYRALVRYVACDAPMQASGRNNSPVVMDLGSGKASRS